MNLRTGQRLLWLGLVCAALAAPRLLRAQDGAPHVELIAPKFYLISNASGNLVLMTGEDSSLVAGIQDPALVQQALATLAEKHAPPVKYAISLDGDQAATFRDGGWGHRGAQTLAHELLFARMRKTGAAAGAAPGAAAAATDVALPMMGFSEVLQLHITGEDTHVIHQRAGYTDADTVLHFEGSGIAFLGPAFTTDGYPAIDAARGGKLASLIQTIDFFAANFAQRPASIEPIIPGRGPVATMDDLRAYAQMLHAVHDRVATLAKAGKPVADVVAAKPTAEFDAKWGHGPVTPDQFVAMVFAGVAHE